MPDTSPSPSVDQPQPLDAIIIGAGFSGLYQLHCLRDHLGLSVQVLEMAEGVGGTWYWNRYPGARCDSESQSYQYYFSKDLLENWAWSERFPQQPEIVEYMNFVADRLDLKRNVRFGIRVTSAHYDEAANQWTVETDAGDRYTAQFLITGVGCLSSANVPDIPGLDSFAGNWYHTGLFPHEGVDFSEKRVGLVGTGSTGIQSTPEIAKTAKHLTVFQRTANYSIPAHNTMLTDEFKRYCKEHHADIREVMHTSPNGHPFRIQERLALDSSEEERAVLYEKAWAKGGLEFRSVFEDLLVNKAANDTAADFIRSKIRSIVKDPDTAALLSNIDHPFATKRPPVDDHYFEAYNRDNVTLVDVRAAPIQHITPTGIVTEDGEYDLDIIVFATGFDAMTGTLLKLDIHGRDGLPLKEAWSAGPRTYLGLQVAGFPNLFTITGPGSPSVLCNMPVAIEQHVEWITDCIAHMHAQGLDKVEAKVEAADQWVLDVNAAAEATLLPQAGHSWYLGANVPGKPRVFMPYAGGMASYRKICDDVAERGYEGFTFSGQTVSAS